MSLKEVGYKWEHIFYKINKSPKFSDLFIDFVELEVLSNDITH